MDQSQESNAAENMQKQMQPLTGQGEMQLLKTKIKMESSMVYGKK